MLTVTSLLARVAACTKPRSVESTKGRFRATGYLIFMKDSMSSNLLRRLEKLENVHFSSKTDDWATPQAFFDAYDLAYDFATDVCATVENTKAPLFFTIEDDGLVQEWRGVCWMNPPYGKTIGLWVKKAYESAKTNGATVVCLLPARTDTRWWHDYCIKGQIEFIKGRLKFGDSTNSAPFPSAVVVFRATP